METKRIVTQKTKPSSTLKKDYACKLCNRCFESLQECLKHELLEHSMTKKRPEKAIRNQLQALSQIVQDEDKQRLQAQVEAAIDSCQPGEELKAILKLNCIDTEKLEQAYLRIYTCLNKELQKIGKFGIFPFGSVANGLALQSSDIDIYIEIDDYDDHTSKHFRIIFNRVSSFLFRSQCFSDIVPIRQARVPIIKCKHVLSGYSIDINMSCPSSVNNTNFLRDIIRSDSRLHQLLLFLKIWSKHLQIIGRGGNMTSYCLVTIAIFYLQNTPNSNMGSTTIPILPSLEALQKYTAPNIVQGVNYAYDLQHIAPLSNQHNVRSLIEGFFKYYEKFDFIHNILSPYLGHTISRDQFMDNGFQSYKDQMRALTIIKGSPAMPLQVQQSICVQDIFCLNLNVARAITPPNFEYIGHCFTCAARICSAEPRSRLDDAQFYKMLLYGIVEQISKIIELKKNVDSSASANSSAFNFTIAPSRIEMRSLVMHSNEIAKDKISLHKMWVQIYMEFIKELLTDIYKLDMQQALPTHCLKNKKLESSDLTQTWLLTGSVDMWTGRMFEGRSSVHFMKHHKQLTEKFQAQRRQNSVFAVQMSALLTLKIATNYSAIELTIQPTAAADANKKNPLRKFFGNFKVGLQSFNLKEKLLPSTNLDASNKLLQGLEKKEEKCKQTGKKPAQSHTL